MGPFKCCIAVLSLALLGACQQTDSVATATPQPTSSVKTVETTAVVKIVDLDTRQVLLEAPNGRLETIVAGPEVRNLAQVMPGDVVKAVYEQSVAVQMVAHTGGSASTDAAVAVARAAEGDKPAAMVGDVVRSVVQIVSFDADSNLVTFSAPDGFVHSVVIQEPEFQEFARGLKPGDEVEVTFTEAFAIAVVGAGQ